MRNRRKLAMILGLPGNYFKKGNVYYYTEFSRPKQNGEGTRHYCVPDAKLKNTQKRICVLLSRIVTPQWLISGKKRSSYVTNAEMHVNNRYIKTMDITDFYNSTQKEYVYKLFRETFKMEDDIAWLMTDLVMYKGHLPTGSPSSQAVVFWTYKDMFDDIYNISQKYGCVFTLYVDDMTFSSDKPIPSELRKEVERLLNHYGLHAKAKKDHYYQSDSMKMVTGVGIHKGKMVVPNKRRQSILGQYEKCKITDDFREIEKLQGMLNSLRQIEPHIFPEIENYIKHKSKGLLEYRRSRFKKTEITLSGKHHCFNMRTSRQ